MNRKFLHQLRDVLVLIAAQEKVDLPLYRWDGEFNTPEEVALELGIAEVEADVRLNGAKALRNHKDVHGRLASHDVSVGVGTTIHQRIRKFVERPHRRRKKKRKREKEK